MPRTAQQKKNILLWVFAIFVLFAIVGIKTWVDKNKDHQEFDGNKNMIVYGYMTDNVQVLSHITSHQKENILYAGEFTPSGLSTPSYDLASIAKINPQPLNLFFKFNGIAPYMRTQHHIDQIIQILDQYHDQGINIHEVFIDYRPTGIKKFDFTRFNTFTAELRRDLHREHALGVFLNDQWFRNDNRKDREIALRRLGNMSKNVRTFFFDMDEARKENEDLTAFINRMNEYKFAFVLRINDKEDADTISKTWHKPFGFFVGTLIDFDPKAPISTKEPQTTGENK